MASTQIDLNKPCLNADGHPFKLGEKDLTLAVFLSNLLFNMKSNQPDKPFFWALDLRKEGALTVDETDKAFIVDFIRNHENVSVLEKGRLLEPFL